MGMAFRLKDSATGLPIPYQYVVLYDTSGNYEGGFQCDDVGYVLINSVYGVHYVMGRALGYNLGPQFLNNFDVIEPVIDIFLSQNALTYNITVRDSGTNAPIPTAMVSLTPPSGNMTPIVGYTDELGLVSLMVTPSASICTVTAVGYNPNAVSPVSTGETVYLTPLAVTSTTYSIWVKSIAYNVAVPNATVKLVYMSTQVSGTTNADGFVSLTITPSANSCEVTATGFVPQTISPTVAMMTVMMVPITVPPVPTTYSIWVKDDYYNNPVPSATVTLFKGSASWSGITDAGGFVSISTLDVVASGRITASGFSTYSFSDITTSMTKYITAVGMGYNVTVRWLNSTTVPLTTPLLPGALVRLISGPDEWLGTTNPSGYVSITTTAVPISMIVTASGYKPYALNSILTHELNAYLEPLSPTGAAIDVVLGNHVFTVGPPATKRMELNIGIVDIPDGTDEVHIMGATNKEITLEAEQLSSAAVAELEAVWESEAELYLNIPMFEEDKRCRIENIEHEEKGGIPEGTYYGVRITVVLTT